MIIKVTTLGDVMLILMMLLFQNIFETLIWVVGGNAKQSIKKEESEKGHK